MNRVCLRRHTATWICEHTDAAEAGKVAPASVSFEPFGRTCSWSTWAAGQVKKEGGTWKGGKSEC
jgi:hypothetical protein